MPSLARRRRSQYGWSLGAWADGRGPSDARVTPRSQRHPGAGEVALGSKVDNVALLRIAVASFSNIRPRLPQLKVFAEPVKPTHQGINVPISLLAAPSFGGVAEDLYEVRFRPGRKPIDHFFARCSRPAALIRSASFGSSSAS